MSDDIAKRYDPRGLIADALTMEGLSAEECRAIFFDWAFGQRDEDPVDAAKAMLIVHADAPVDHPMIALLRAAGAGAAKARGRRGGARGARGMG